MAVSTTVEVRGTILKKTSRSITKASTGEVFVFNNALIIGEHSLAEVRIPDDFVEKFPEQGKPVGVRCVVTSYRDQPELSVEAYI